MRICFGFSIQFKIFDRTNISNEEIEISNVVEVQVHSGPGEVDPQQEHVFKMKRFDSLVSTMISNYCAGVTSRLQAAHHQ